MSFAGNVKDELTKHYSTARHCQLAELAAMYDFSRGEGSALIETESLRVAKKCFTLLKKTYNMYCGVSSDEVESYKDGNIYRFTADEAECDKIVSALTSPAITQKSCCRRAYLRGAFLCAGSVSDPAKSYHLEYVCQSEKKACEIRDMLGSFSIESKIIQRKRNFVVYIKEGSGIVEVLNVIEAHVALMEFENSRILKEMRNSVNRRVNCETANISKTVSAAVRQIEDIEFVMRMPEYKSLPEQLREIAELRLSYPNVSLKELGELCKPEVGKSGVNHRLRRLSEIAEKYREKEEQHYDEKRG